MVRTSKPKQSTAPKRTRKRKKKPVADPRLKKKFLKDIVPLNQEAIPNKGGRPPVYDDRVTPELAYRFCLLGCTDEQLANAMGQNVGTIYEWKKEYPKFSNALRDGKEKADAEVVHSVRNRAIGYDTQEHVYKRMAMVDADGDKILDENGQPQYQQVLVQTNVKHIPADGALAKFWLWNRTKNNPDNTRWTDKQEIDHKSSDGSMSPQETVIVLPAKVGAV